MAESLDSVRSALRSLIGAACRRSLATNSLMLRFDFGLSEKGRAYIWIDPPWRMTLAGRLVSGSADWPVWDGVEKKEVNQPLWEAWCDLFNPLNSTTLTEASVGSDMPDLHLDFASGHQIETLGNCCDDYSWYYRDRLTGEVFEAGPTGITHRIAESAE